MIPFDFILLAILLVSAVLGYLQGALKELVSLVSLVLALALAIVGFRSMEPVVDSWINPDWAAPPLTFLLLFVGAYLGLRVVGAGLAGGLRQARLLNAMDRAMGFAFGLIRATLFLGVCNLAKPPPIDGHPGILTMTPRVWSAASSGSSMSRTPRRSRRWGCTPFSTGDRKPAASPASTGTVSTPSDTWAMWATPSRAVT